MDAISEEDFVAYEKWCEKHHQLPWCCEIDPSPVNKGLQVVTEDGSCLYYGPVEVMIHIRKAPYEWQKRYIDRWKNMI